MKTLRFPPVAILVAAVAPSFFGCSRNGPASTAAAKADAGARNVASDVRSTASDSWDSIKDYAFAKRAEFCASMDRMAGRLDDKARELKAKLSGAPAAVSDDRDRGLREYDEARADLKSRLSELGNSTADTWADAKEKVTKAWQRVQSAYEKLAPNASS